MDTTKVKTVRVTQELLEQIVKDAANKVLKEDIEGFTSHPEANDNGASTVAQSVNELINMAVTCRETISRNAMITTKNPDKQNVISAIDATIGRFITNMKFELEKLQEPIEQTQQQPEA